VSDAFSAGPRCEQPVARQTADTIIAIAHRDSGCTHTRPAVLTLVTLLAMSPSSGTWIARRTATSRHDGMDDRYLLC
jgi:hypothetical protein